MVYDLSVAIHYIAVAAVARRELEHLGIHGAEQGVSECRQSSQHALELVTATYDRHSDQDHVFARNFVLENMGEGRLSSVTHLIEFGRDGAIRPLPLGNKGL